MSIVPRLMLLLLATGCAAKAGEDDVSRSDVRRKAGAGATLCTRHVLVARDTMHRLMTSIVASKASRLPGYVLPAIAGEVALRIAPLTPPRHFRSGVVSFTVRSSGEAEDVRLESAGDVTVDSMMLVAIQQAGSMRQFALQPGDRHLRPLRFELRMWTEPNLASRLERKLHADTLPYPFLSVEVEPLLLPGGPRPAFPELGRQAGIGDDLLTQFVINVAGRAEPGSFRMLKATYKEYVDAIVAVLPFMRFKPAQIQGCPVPVLVQLPFLFHIGQ